MGADDVRFGYLGSLFARSLFTALPADELGSGDVAHDRLALLTLERVRLDAGDARPHGSRGRSPPRAVI